MHRQPPPEELGPFQFAVLVLSLALLVGLLAEWLLPVPTEVQRLVFFIDTAICGVLFIDVAIRFHAAPSKLAFLKWGWLDLLACIPAVDALRFARLFRVIRVLRLIIAIHSLRRFIELLWVSKSRAGVAAVFVIGFVVVSFGSAGVLLAERTPDANIKTAEDALWWSITTVTTVGYGDRYPVTVEGRLIAIVLMISGISIFGTLSGVAAGIFLGGDKDEPASRAAQREMLERIAGLQQEIIRLQTASSQRSASPGTAPPS